VHGGHPAVKRSNSVAGLPLTLCCWCKARSRLLVQRVPNALWMSWQSKVHLTLQLGLCCHGIRELFHDIVHPRVCFSVISIEIILGHDRLKLKHLLMRIELVMKRWSIKVHQGLILQLTGLPCPVVIDTDQTLAGAECLVVHL
jgi:hypothetical protein